MMLHIKRIKYMLICSIVSLLAIAQKSKNEEYVFPVEMKPQVKEAYILEFNKGKILYSINCAKCHSTFEKKREIIPNFTEEQFEAYKIRVANAQHEQNISEEQLAPDELGMIITYLTYRKKEK